MPCCWYIMIEYLLLYLRQILHTDLSVLALCYVCYIPATIVYLQKWYLASGVVCVLDIMPCWFFNKSELENTPSFHNGVDAAAEEKYRREGAKLITDAGSAVGLYPVIFVN